MTFSRYDDGAGFYRTPRRLIWGFFLPYFALLIAGVVLIALSSGRGTAWVAGLALILTSIVFRFTVGWLDRRRLPARLLGISFDTLPEGFSPVWPAGHYITLIYQIAQTIRGAGVEVCQRFPAVSHLSAQWTLHVLKEQAAQPFGG